MKVEQKKNRLILSIFGDIFKFLDSCTQSHLLLNKKKNCRMSDEALKEYTRMPNMMLTLLFFFSFFV